MQAGWTQFVAQLGAVSPIAFQLGVAAYDRAHNGAGAIFTPLSNITVETLTATQRRRQPGRKVARHRHRITT
jgi:hypothetical protein